MRKIIIIYAVLAVGFFGCKTHQVDSHWLDHPVKIDGDVNEWQSIPLLSVEESEMSLGITNDADNLFVMVAFKDLSLARMYRMNGLKIWINTESKEDKDVGVRYVGQIRNAPPGDDRTMEGLSQERREMFQNRMAQLEKGLTIITKEGITFYPRGENKPICSAASEYGSFIFEFMIPLRKDKSTPFAIGKSAGEKFNLCFELSPSDFLQDRSGSQRKQKASGVRLGYDQREREGRWGGLNGMPDWNGNRQMEKVELWFNIKLAVSE